jgi:hypothetical protein
MEEETVKLSRHLEDHDALKQEYDELRRRLIEVCVCVFVCVGPCHASRGTPAPPPPQAPLHAPPAKDPGAPHAPAVLLALRR